MKTMRGSRSLRKIAEMTDKLEMHHPMIVGLEPLTGKLMKTCPAMLSSPVFSGFHPNPDLADATAGAELFQREKCDGLVSIGGGSSIDTAKAIKAFLNVRSFDEIASNHYPDHMTVPHIAIPGTAGTGSEATQTAVVYVNGKKISLNHPDLLADGVILDAELLETLPLYHKKSCALDALAQGIESYWCNSATPDSRVHSYLAILGVLDNLKAYLAGDSHAASEMLDASFQSGKAIQITRTTAAHAMSYQITKMFGLAHGHAVMITLPALWEMASDREEMKTVLKELSGFMRLGDPLMVPRLLKGMMLDLDMKIPEMPDQNTLDILTDSVNAERLSNHPVFMSREDVREAYRRSFAPMGEAQKQACLDIWRYYNGK